MSTVQFAYDGQLRRFVLQFIRMFSNFQVEFGKDSQGNRTLQTIPVYYGNPSRQGAAIIQNNSENMLNAVPAMAAYINELTYDRERLLNPFFESKTPVREQVFNEVTQTYTGTQDGIYTVERLMPAPYKLSMKLDIWTSNTEQKHQILEQILPLFNPGLEIQSTDNYLDWSSLSVVLLTGVSYTNRTVPKGADESIEITSLSFEMPIYLNLPAKVKKMGVVAQIIANLHNPEGDLSPDFVYTMQGLVSQQRFTPLNYEIVYVGNTLQLFQGPANYSSMLNVRVGNAARWEDMVNLYGQLRNGISQVRLNFTLPDGDHEIVGTVAYDPTDPTMLLFTPIPETLPTNTLPAVTAIIDPMTVTVDSNILSPAVGTRYLILNPIGNANTESAPAWSGSSGTNLIAQTNDIIEWNGNYWTVSFDSSNNKTVQYVTNMNTNVQYRWTSAAWVKSYEGLYRPGEWSLVL